MIKNNNLKEKFTIASMMKNRLIPKQFQLPRKPKINFTV